MPRSSPQKWAFAPRFRRHAFGWRSQPARRAAGRLGSTVEQVWRPNTKPGGYFHGTIACLSALFHAGRHDELLALIEKAPYSMWHYRQWGVKALAAMGRKAEAIRFAEASHGLNVNPIAIARACEEILFIPFILSSCRFSDQQDGQD